MSDATPASRRPVKGWLIAVAAVLAVAGVIAAFGGFGPRQVDALAAQPGEEVDAHNLVFRLDSATVQHLRNDDKEPWKVVVSGSVRNPTDQTLYPETGRWGNLVAIVDGGEPERTGDFSAQLGPQAPDQTFGSRRVIPPNDSWMALTATFRFAAFPDVSTLTVAVVPMEFTANTILGLNDTPQWNVASFELPTAVRLPVTRLPDSDY